MSVPAAPKSQRIRTPRRLPLALPLLTVPAAGAAGAVAFAAAPDPARPWVAGTAAAAWAWLAAASLVGSLRARRLHSAAAEADAGLLSLRTQSARTGAEAAHLVNVTLPAAVQRLRDGETPEAVLASAALPQDPQLLALLHSFVGGASAAEQRARTAEAAAADALGRLGRAADDVDRMTTVTLPEAIARLRQGASADTALAALEQPADPRLRVVLESIVREFALSERRASAAMGAGSKTLSRVQAKAVTMLADLREMQDRHGEDVFGDLLRLDHNTSQLGLLADRLSLLLGGRTSRTWNKPIAMESILRGAVGRISAYQRVRLHSSSTAQVAGYAAEGVMHLLAELIDNAANFSPPIDEVHVYVEERTAGLVVTVEDSGLKMADAAMRRAEEAVAGKGQDLALLRSTRIGLVVVGLLADKYDLTVNFRPSSRGGTGVVVLFPPQLLHQSRGSVREPEPRTAPPAPTGRRPAERPATVAGDTPGTPAARPVPQPRTPLPAKDAPRVATRNGLPVRPPGRTMAAADRGRNGSGAQDGDGTPQRRDAGTQFGAFHRSRPPRGDGSGTPDR
jgi:signal transduction histidine kinase